VRDSGEPARLDSFGERRLARPGRISPAACSSCGRTDAIAVIPPGLRPAWRTCRRDRARTRWCRHPSRSGAALLRILPTLPLPGDASIRSQARSTREPSCRPVWLPSPRGRIARRFRRSCNTGEGSDRQAGYPHRVALSPGQIKTWVACGRPVGQTRSVDQHPLAVAFNPCAFQVNGAR
jgi:hypothetical protein